jgi:hypothetical protein
MMFGHQSIGHLFKDFGPLHIVVGSGDGIHRPVELAIIQRIDLDRLSSFDRAFRPQSQIERCQFIPKGESPPIDSHGRGRERSLYSCLRGRIEAEDTGHNRQRLTEWETLRLHH